MQLQVTPVRRMPLAIPVLDYLCPDELSPDVSVGSLVSIVLRGKKEFGVVTSLKKSSDIAGAKLKPVTGLVFRPPLLAPEIVAFYGEMAEFYHASPGFLYKSSLFELQKSKIVKLSETLEPLPENKKIVSKKPQVKSYNDLASRDEILKDGLVASGQRLFLTPNVHSARQIAELLKSAGAKEIKIVAGENSVSEYFDAWTFVRNNPDAIVVGTRKAIFLPWINLSVIIMDNEGSFDYKSWDMAPRYQTRDAILMLAKHTGAQVIFSSMAPSVESWFFARHKVYENLGALTAIKSPSPIFIDSAKEQEFGSSQILAQEIIDEIDRTENNVLVITTKRGTATGIICHDCGHIFRCEKCHRPFAFYSDTHELKCHYCKITRPLADNCPQCNNIRFRMLGPGTDGIGRELKKRLANPKKISVLDDSATEIKKTNFTAQNNIFIGTSGALPFIADLNIRFVVMADPDVVLTLPEYKSAEELWQKIRLVQIGLPSDGQFYIQTKLSDHHVFQGVYNPDIFYAKEIADRKAFDYPPAKFLLRLYYGGKTPDEAENEAERLFKALNGLTQGRSDAIISSPMPANPPFYRQEYWRVILIKIGYSAYKKTVKALLEKVPEDWKVDPNPNNTLSIT